MPLRPARVGRVGVIGAPVAKTAVVAAAVTPGPSPVAKTAVVAAPARPGGGAGESRPGARSEPERPRDDKPRYQQGRGAATGIGRGLASSRALG